MNTIEITDKELETKSEKELRSIKSLMRNTLYKLQDEYAQERYGNPDVRNELKLRIVFLRNRIATIKKLLT